MRHHRTLFFHTRLLYSFIVCIFILPQSSSSDRIKAFLKDGTVIEGDKKSENLNFIVIDPGNAPVSLLKTKIDTIINTGNLIVTNSTAGNARQPQTQPEKISCEKITPQQPKLTTVNKPDAVIRENKIPYEELLKTADTSKILDLSYRDMERLPASVNFFKRVRHLDLKGNKLIELPEEIGDLTTLLSLDLRMNHLSGLPPHVSNLTGLEVLMLSGNKINDNELFHLRRALPSTRIIYTPGLPISSRKLRPAPLQSGEYPVCDSLLNSCRTGNRAACHQLGLKYMDCNDYEQAAGSFEEGCKISTWDTTAITVGNCEEASRCLTFLGDKTGADAYLRHICKIAPQRSQVQCRSLR
jgi:hypothetical protein